VGRYYLPFGVGHFDVGKGGGVVEHQVCNDSEVGAAQTRDRVPPGGSREGIFTAIHSLDGIPHTAGLKGL